MIREARRFVAVMVVTYVVGYGVWWVRERNVLLSLALFSVLAAASFCVMWQAVRRVSVEGKDQ